MRKLASPCSAEVTTGFLSRNHTPVLVASAGNRQNSLQAKTEAEHMDRGLQASVRM